MGKRKIVKPIEMTSCSCGHPIAVMDDEQFDQHLKSCPLNKKHKKRAYRLL